MLTHLSKIVLSAAHNQSSYHGRQQGQKDNSGNLTVALRVTEEKDAMRALQPVLLSRASH